MKEVNINADKMTGSDYVCDRCDAKTNELIHTLNEYGSDEWICASCKQRLDREEYNEQCCY